MLCLSLAACGGGGGGGGGGNASTPPSISYGGGVQFALTTQNPVSLTPTNHGGPVSTWTIAPALPAGLAFSSSTGMITGTPTDAFAPTNVTVTAANSAGASHVTLTLSAGSVLLNLGVTCLVDLSGAFQQGMIAISDTNLLVEGCGQNLQHWALWNFSSGAILAQGDACPANTCQGLIMGGWPPNVELAGQIAVVPHNSAAGSVLGFQVLSVTDGSVLSTIVPSGGVRWWRVASDGSYICGSLVNGGTLNVWAPDGSVLATSSGNYGSATAYCVPGEVRVARGPKGSNVIETIAVPSGASSLSPTFAGTFNSWFEDGSSFLANVGTSVWVYSPAAVQQDFRTLPTAVGLAGWGPWFWTADGTTLNIYKVGASASPAASYTAANVMPSGSTIGILGSPLRIIDLSGATPSEADYSPPFDDVYAAVSASQWVVGNGYTGAILDGASLSGTPRYFGYGRVFSIAGSPARLAVGTAIGKVLVFNSMDLSLESTLDLTVDQLAISADGSVLAARSSAGGASSVSTIALPAGTVINTWSYPAGGPQVGDITLSSSGALLGQVLTTGRQVTADTGGPVLWSDSGSTPIRLSLDDTLIAVSDSAGNTAVYQNFVSSTAVPGLAVGWLQGDELLQNVSGSGEIFSSAGLKQSAPTLPGLSGPIQVLSATSIFDEPSNSIYSLSSGAKTFSTINAAGPGAIAGARVAYPTASDQLVAEPY